VEIQAGEYGADAPGRLMHRDLFAATMRHLGLDDRSNAYLDRLPASALVISNLISCFGLNARWAPALVGQLSVFEQTSVEPMGRYARALARMQAPAEARRFYEVHVQADAEHEVMAPAMVRALVEDQPSTFGNVVFGAQAALVVEAWFAQALLSNWTASDAA
jgi:Iron-containing redox enzyme